VPGGSVAIAGRQTAVYPIETPGGWHLLGRTDLPLFDPGRDPPALLGVGDSVRFEAIP
jgi:allophanate hydrolase subunit 1